MRVVIIVALMAVLLIQVEHLVRGQDPSDPIDVEMGPTPARAMPDAGSD